MTQKTIGSAGRLTITFSRPALRWLNAEAKTRAITVTELMRRLVDEARGDVIHTIHSLDRGSGRVREGVR
jgi:hypothetical protein